MPRLLLPLLLVLIAVPVSAQPLRLAMTATPDPVEPGELITFTIVATNGGGAEIQDVTLQIALPGLIQQFDYPTRAGCPGFYCEAGEVMEVELGNLAPGQARAFSFGTFVRTDAADGALIQQSVIAAASGGLGATASVSVPISTSRTLSLALSNRSGPVALGDTLSYRLVVANDGGINSSARVTMALPPGLRFLGANGGGQREGNHVVWTFGALTPGTGARMNVHAVVEADRTAGSFLLASVEVARVAGGEVLARAVTATAVAIPPTLRLSATASSDAVSPNGFVILTLTVTNRSAVAVDFDALLALPGAIRRFDYPSGTGCPGFYCEAGETMEWEGAILAAGQSRSLTFGVFADANADSGTLLQFTAAAFADGKRGGTAAVAIIVGQALTVAAEPERAGASFGLKASPNPATFSATITLALAAPGPALVEAYDLLGRRVRTLFNGPLEAGAHPFRLDVTALPPGLYLCRAQVEGQVQVERLVVTR